MEATAGVGMTRAGWVFLVLAWAVIFGLVGYCFRKILAGPEDQSPAAGDPSEEP